MESWVEWIAEKRKHYNKQSVSQQLEKHIILSPQWSEKGLTEEALEWSQGCTISLQTQSVRKKTKLFLSWAPTENKTKQNSREQIKRCKIAHESHDDLRLQVASENTSCVNCLGFY